jgi:uncharacterized RDD family membrane protein YckC
VAVVQRLDRYPFPIAHPARALTTAREPTDQLERAGHLVEMSAVTLGVLVLGWSRSRAISFDAADRWHQALDRKGAALGGWIDLVRAATRALADHPNDPMAHAVRASAVDTTTPLDEFVRIRNTYSHGGRPRIRGEVDGAVRELTQRASAVLDRVAPLTTIRLGVVRSCGKRPHARMYDVDLDVLAGYADLFSHQRLRSGRPFDEGSVLAYLPNSLEHAIELTPYCVWRRCRVCGRDELFYLTKTKRSGSHYYSFSTGHQLELKDDGNAATPTPMAQMGMTSLGSRRSAATDKWRATWSDLAPRHRRLAARTIDTVMSAALGTLGWLLGALIGLPVFWDLLIAVALAAAYEPMLALTGETLGKRLLRIQPISTWDCRPLNRADLLRRALVADLQFIPFVAVHNLAWVLWDPARQCWHDRVAGSIVVTGRARTPQKR